MKTTSKTNLPIFIMALFFLFSITNRLLAQTGTYNQTASNIYSVNSYTNVTFTGTPLYASSGTLSFQWIACHQPGFGASTIYVELFTGTGYQNIATYSSSLDCSSISQNISLSGSQLSDAALYANGNIVFRFYISDGCQAGVGCAGVNDPAVISINLTYSYSVADFTVSDTTLCPGQSTTFTDITPGTVNSRSWSFPGGTPASATGITPTITYNNPGFYNVTLTTTGPGGSNSTTKTSLIYVYSSPTAIINAGGPTTFCEGGNVLLNSTTGAGFSYQWKKSGNNLSGGTSSSWQATATGNYKVIITSSEGCSSTSNTISVTENANPVAIISANGPLTFCPGGSVSLQATVGGGLSYQWKKNGSSIAAATTSTYIASASGTYTCKITNGNGCSSVSNGIVITVNTPKATITLTGSDTVCQGVSVLLKANKGAGLTYQWIRNGANISGATDSTYTVTVTGNYKVKVTNNCGNSTSGVISIKVNQLPSANITASGPLTFCSGSTVTLNANTGIGLTYVWKKNNSTIGGATGSSYVASTNGSYKVVITNASGCSSVSNTLTVTVNSTIASISAGGPTSFCNGDSVVLSANSGAGLAYQWLKNNVSIIGATSIGYTAKTAGTYKCIVNNINTGCAAISSGISVIVNCKNGTSASSLQPLVTPNPFNDGFFISFPDFNPAPVTMEIYSITGQLMQKNTVTDLINGIHTGHALKEGVYFLRLIQQDEILHMKIVKNR